MSENEKMPFERSYAPKIEELNAIFENYKFKSLITVGGMGAVYLAEQTSLERAVAIKILPRRYSRNETFYEAFQNEAKIIAKLNHQNLVSVYDFGVKEEYPFLIMEYAFGQSLEKFITNELISYKHASRLILNLCLGVKHAHKRNVVHRDIKPANIILTSDGEVKLVDFGIAKNCGYIPFKSGDMIFGTKGFAAPEISNSPHLIDARSDIYAIGASLCQLVTGFTPDNLIKNAIDKRHLLGSLYSVVFKCIRTDPAKRYQDIEELEFAIEDALSHERELVKPKDQETLLVQDDTGKSSLFETENLVAVSVEQQKKKLIEETEKETGSGVFLADRYKLMDCLRQGPKMMVYRARDMQMKRIVKVRMFFNSNGEEWKPSFFKILSDLSRVEHPNIPKVLDAGLHNVGAFIVYNWVQGERIQDWLENKLDYDSFYTLMLQVLDTLEVASHYGFHHYALNSYSLVQEERTFLAGRFLLLDLGVSEVLSLIHEEGSMLHGVRKEWAAPELFQSLPSGEKTTVFIFAQLLMTLLLKGHPLADLSEDEIRKAYEEGYRIDVLEHRDDLPDDFADWLNRLLEPDLGKRFSTIREARKSMPEGSSSVRL